MQPIIYLLVNIFRYAINNHKLIFFNQKTIVFSTEPYIFGSNEYTLHYNSFTSNEAITISYSKFVGIHCETDQYGGAIHYQKSDGILTMSNSFFYDCSIETVGGRGGAIYFNGVSATIAECCIYGCYVSQTRPSMGSFAYIVSSNNTICERLSVVSCSGYEGTTCFEVGETKINNFNSSSHSAIRWGSTFWSELLSTKLTILHSTFEGSEGPSTIAVLNYGSSTVTFETCNIIFNKANTVTNAAIIMTLVPLEIINTLIIGNDFDYFAELHNDGSIDLHKCIWDEGSYQIINDGSGSVNTNDLVEDNNPKIHQLIHYNSYLCQGDATHFFTASSVFTLSEQFTESVKFSMSNDFTKSDNFIETSSFTESDDFSYSNIFSETNGFSQTNIFSETLDFSHSDIFSQSNKFSSSFVFSQSDIFSSSDHFSSSNQFSSSHNFSSSDGFTTSQIFTNSEPYSHSYEFSQSHHFEQTNYFSNSRHFSNSESFSRSNIFSKSSQFTHSDEFSESKDFSTSIVFSNSNDFSKSIIFSETLDFTSSLSFILNHVNSFTETELSDLTSPSHESNDMYTFIIQSKSSAEMDISETSNEIGIKSSDSQNNIHTSYISDINDQTFTTIENDLITSTIKTESIISGETDEIQQISVISEQYTTISPNNDDLSILTDASSATEIPSIKEISSTTEISSTIEISSIKEISTTTDSSIKEISTTTDSSIKEISTTTDSSITTDSPSITLTKEETISSGFHEDLIFTNCETNSHLISSSADFIIATELVDATHQNSDSEFIMSNKDDVIALTTSNIKFTSVSHQDPDEHSSKLDLVISSSVNSHIPIATSELAPSQDPPLSTIQNLLTDETSYNDITSTDENNGGDSNSAKGKNKSGNTGIVIGIVAGVIVVIVAIILLAFFYIKRKKVEQSHSETEMETTVNSSYVENVSITSVNSLTSFALSIDNPLFSKDNNNNDYSADPFDFEENSLI
ncbi:hypothetical protein TRFO_24089 [Tritrichomonas foetus]|uniref:Uncharacterized protein n=1 Tax=Tritrichomonas foetus TaxID=1144522 RepID=A0A1J4K8D8_9EUKA|nr:hypothetical protein TRFO_24089 [Tritrichomonas foetus]|eukprot:OHT07671.1 hypothetical protein TRFO_24089 [Tritrichomonas foetus]